MTELWIICKDMSDKNWRSRCPICYEYEACPYRARLTPLKLMIYEAIGAAIIIGVTMAAFRIWRIL